MSRGRAGLEAMVRLRNGVEIPCVGLGTYKAQGAEAREAVLFSLRKGIRHIDTASIYHNHAEVAAAIRESGVPREELFITSKISPYQQGTAKAEEAFNQALEELGVDYLDLMLIHWPGASRIPLTSTKHAELRLESWRVLERKHREGLVRAIGVSNFLQHHLEHLINAADVTPMINQVEMHPRYPQSALRRFCAESGIVVEAYSSLGCGELLNHPVVQQVAARVGRSASQVLLRWGLQNDCIVLPKSVTPERIRLFAPPEQLTSSSWSLDADSMRDLDALDDGTKFCWDPSVVTF